MDMAYELLYSCRSNLTRLMFLELIGKMPKKISMELNHAGASRKDTGIGGLETFQRTIFTFDFYFLFSYFCVEF